MDELSPEQLEEFLALQEKMLLSFQVLSKAMVMTATAIREFYIVMEKTGVLDDPVEKE